MECVVKIAIYILIICWFIICNLTGGSRPYYGLNSLFSVHSSIHQRSRFPWGKNEWTSGPCMIKRDINELWAKGGQWATKGKTLQWLELYLVQKKMLSVLEPIIPALGHCCMSGSRQWLRSNQLLLLHQSPSFHHQVGSGDVCSWLHNVEFYSQLLNKSISPYLHAATWITFSQWLISGIQHSCHKLSGNNHFQQGSQITYPWSSKELPLANPPSSIFWPKP